MERYASEYCWGFEGGVVLMGGEVSGGGATGRALCS